MAYPAPARPTGAPAHRVLDRVFPILPTLRGYRLPWLRDDAVAGGTTAVMLIPQAMGYAMLAELDPIYGLYASMLPLAVYALFGTARQLAVGPVAMDSLLTAAAVSALAPPGTEPYVAYAVFLALLVGLVQLLMGLLRLGFLVNFLSSPVISGFVSAAALIIASSQLKHLMGVSLPATSFVHVTLLHAVQLRSAVHLPTLLLGLVSAAALVGLKAWAPRFPRALFVVLVGSSVVYAFGLEAQGVAIVGAVPRGLPPMAIPVWDWEVVQELMPAAVTIALVAYLEAIAVAKKYAAQYRYDLDSNQELIALGFANMAASLTSGYSVTGGLSRTSINAQAGARTPLAGVFTAGFVLLTLVFLTPLFYFLPKAILAAIIVTAVFGLIDTKLPARLLRINPVDFAVLAVTFVATLLLGIQEGIVVGVGVSLALLVFRSTRPHFAVLGRLPGSGLYRNIRRFPEARTTPGVLALRVDAQMYFGNVNFLKETLRKLEREADAPLRAVVLDASGVNQLDASAVTALEEILQDYQSRGIRFVLANTIGPVRDVLARAGLVDLIGADNQFLRVEDAMMAVTAEEAAS